MRGFRARGGHGGGGSSVKLGLGERVGRGLGGRKGWWRGGGVSVH